ncbi:MAG: FxsA family protein [Kiloniellales bacterium]
MGLLLLAAFIAVPLVEIAVFIQIGGLIGLWPTLAVVVATAVAGTWLLRLQGIATLNRARQQMDRGAMPARELFDGLCLVFAGALLLTPGFVTDAVGLLLFVPAVRDALRRAAASRLETQAAARVYVNPGFGRGGSQESPRPTGQPDPNRDAGADPPPHPGQGWGRRSGSTTIDGDFREVTDGQPDQPPGSDDTPDDRSGKGPAKPPSGETGS